jgi:hypothetical protein
MKYRRLALVAYALAFSVAIAAAESSSFLDSYLEHGFPENVDTRKQYWTSLITAPKEMVWAFGEKVVGGKNGRVKVKTLQRGADFLVEFVNGSADGFPEFSQGSYIVQRDSKTGYILQAKIFLQDDPGCYARLYPQAEGTRVDVIMYGALVKRGLYVSGLIYYLLAQPFGSIVAETKRSFDWRAVFGLGAPSLASGFADTLRLSFSAAPASPTQASGAPASASLPGAVAAAPTFPLSPSPAGPTGPAFQAASTQPPLPSNQVASSATVPQAGARQGPVAAAAQLPQPPLPRAAFLASLIGKASSMEGLMASLASKGEPAAEFMAPLLSAGTAGASAPPPAALGLSDDSDPLAPRLPYRSFPRYDASHGLPSSALRAAVYLDALDHPDSVYAFVGDSLRVLATPYFDAAGHFRVAFFSDTRELSWDEVSAIKDGHVRVLRLKAQS